MVDIRPRILYNKVGKVRNVKLGGFMDEKEKGKYIWTSKVSGKGQMVIPKEAREVFGIKEGDTLILFGDKEKGIAIAKYDDYIKFAETILNAKGGNKND